ncbi:MAG: 16S rRNA (cytosine(1402)-N(4))-methyltransferase RsmH, partial [Ignavibacteria bacterium]
TLGGGGYTKLICEKSKDNDKVISIDKDLDALEHSKKKLSVFSDKITFVNGSFGDIKNITASLGLTKITGIVLDLGLSSYQLESGTGFSFMKDTKLDMRAYKQDGITAAEILNSFTENELTEIFEKYGEIGNAERLAKSIIKRRRVKKFETTFDLVETVREEYKIGQKNLIDFMAKIFQSLRIEVNSELENLETVLNDSLDLIEKGGRIVVVSYHSLEDRIVKNFFRDQSAKFRKTENPYFDEEIKPRLKILTKKPIIPTRGEIKFNSRSRSAKLRAAEII